MKLELKLSKFLKDIGQDIKLDELIDTLFLLKVELEEMNEEEDMIEFEITPDRVDLLSVKNLIKLVQTYYGWERKEPNFTMNDSDYEINVRPSVLPIRPYIAGAVIKNIIISEDDLIEMIFLQEALHASLARNRVKASIGLYAYDLLRFPLIYEAKSPEEIAFEPLSVGDETFRVMTANMILEQHPTGMKYSHILEGLKKYPIFHDSAENVLSMPPIINSNDLGAIIPDEKNPQNLFVEVTGTKKDVMLNTLKLIVIDAVKRGGEAYQVQINYPDGSEKPLDLSPIPKTMSIKSLHTYLGEPLSNKDIKNYLTRMGYTDISIKGDTVSLMAPANRLDLLHEVDIIEDVIICYGYNKIEPELPEMLTKSSTLPYMYLISQIKEFFAGLGYVEVLNYLLTDQEILSTLMNKEAMPHYRLSNSKLAHYSDLRPEIVPLLLNYLSKNLKNPYPQKVFEVGEVIIPDKKAYNRNLQLINLAAATIGENVNLNKVKSELDIFFNLLQKEVQYKKLSHPSYLEGRAFSINVDNKKIGMLGEVHPQVILNFKLKQPIIALELQLVQQFPEIEFFI
ncbi:MAG: phenylalanine--tRNA ligase subunit beta [Candidatus Helarchaeota archaeon]|nr:phenylalanine--tRNA ligase subunit beta [Candidatus Helarchaeota archaeon]